MKKEKRKTSSGSFSFMDLMFGTLGAVVLLLIITLSLAGPPERIRDQAERTIEWKIVAEKGGIIQVHILGDNSDWDKDGLSVSEEEQSKEIISFVTLKTIGKTLNEERSEYTIILALGRDEILESVSEISLKLSGYVGFTVYSASVSVVPDDNNKGKREIPEGSTLPHSNQWI